MLNKILDRLYVGDADYTPEDLKRYKIDCVINLGGKDGCQDTLHAHIPDDGNQNLGQIEYLVRYLEKLIVLYRKRVLVCCRFGRSRSAFIIALYLQRIGMSFDEAVEFITQQNPTTYIAPGLIQWHYDNWF